MRFAAKALGGLLLLLVVGAGGASVWFWFYPVTVNNVINQFTAEFALDTPDFVAGLTARWACYSSCLAAGCSGVRWRLKPAATAVACGD